ncbi:hypothetical protein E1H99_12245 [Enterococcus hirae]|nr:hypothetical protein E1H99_12245 [Enterococcus hirae]
MNLLFASSTQYDQVLGKFDIKEYLKNTLNKELHYIYHEWIQLNRKKFFDYGKEVMSHGKSEQYKKIGELIYPKVGKTERSAMKK